MPPSISRSSSRPAVSSSGANSPSSRIGLEIQQDIEQDIQLDSKQDSVRPRNTRPRRPPSFAVTIKHSLGRTFPIEIPLASRPKHYRPGDGPPLAPISLVVENDPGAFIVDKRVQPGAPVHGELKLELYYVVGWPDLPAARVSILATDILNYVSPRTLEDWEFKRSLDKDKEDEEEERLERQEIAQRLNREKRARLNPPSVPVKATDAGATATARTGTRRPDKRKHNRLSRAQMFAIKIAEQSRIGEDELANMSLPSASIHGPSLSTPQKRVLHINADVGDSEENEMNHALARQFCQDSQDDSESQAPDDSEMAEPSGIGMDFSSLDCFLPTSEPSPQALFPRNEPSPQTFQFNGPRPVGRPRKGTSQQPPHSNFGSAPSHPSSRPKAPKRRSEANADLPPPYRSSRPDVLIQMPKLPSPDPSPLPSRSSGSNAPNVLEQMHVVRKTSIPPLSYPTPKPAPTTPHVSGFTPIPPFSSSASQPKSAPQVTPVPAPSLPNVRQEKSESPGSTKTFNKISTTAIPPPKPFAANGTKGSEQRTGFTPIQLDLQDRIASNSTTPTPKARSGRKKKQPAPAPAPAPEQEQEQEQDWEILRLEDDRVIETGGALVRYFKVRWKGNWPADLNPSWEPEANIESRVVQKYLNEKQTNSARRGPSGGGPQPTLTRKYSSVAEAFAGGLDE